MEGALLVLLCFAVCVHSYPNGKVTDSCVNMQPNHSGTSPQTAFALYLVSLGQTSYPVGQDIKVILTAPAGQPFEGFLLQAREVGSTSPVGSFVTVPSGTQTLSCSGKTNSAVSHSSNAAKSSIQVTWRPDSGFNKSIQFHATFLKSFDTYWVDKTSPTVTFNGTSGSTAQGSSTVRPSTTLSAAPLDISSAGCGVSKVCFREPTGCDPAQDSGCYFMAATLVSPGDTVVLYELSGPNEGYVAFGFSDDQEMGNDDIYICVLDSNGLVQLQHAFSTGTTTPQNIPLGNVSDVKTSVQDNVIRCSFTSTNTISTQRSTGSSQSYYLLFAHGPSQNGQIQFHTGTFISGNKVDITKPALIQTAQLPHIIKAHGALMLIAWMCTGTLGMIVARFKKGLAKGHTLCGKDMWFVVHVSVMCLTVAATIIAFILAFSYARSWSGGVHPVLGCLVMILSILQPLGALLRCGPKHPKRFLFNWSHALNALAIKVLSVAAIFTGLMLIDTTQNQWLAKVMGGFVGWEALYYTLSDLSLRCGEKSEDTHLFKVMVDSPLMVGIFLLGNLGFLVALLVGIGMS